MVLQEPLTLISSFGCNNIYHTRHRQHWPTIPAVADVTASGQGKHWPILETQQRPLWEQNKGGRNGAAVKSCVTAPEGSWNLRRISKRVANTMENSTAVYQETKNKISIASSNSTFGYTLKRIESRILKRYLYTHLHSSLLQ